MNKLIILIFFIISILSVSSGILVTSGSSSDENNGFPNATMIILEWIIDENYQSIDSFYVNDYSTFYELAKKYTGINRWILDMNCSTDVYEPMIPQLELLLVQYIRINEDTFQLQHSLFNFCTYQCIDTMCYYSSNGTMVGV